MIKSIPLALAGLFLFATQSFAEIRLLMIEQNGCPYCDKWHAEIGGIYPKTSQGRIAPLQTGDLYEPLPDGVDIDGPAVYTPTFILLNDGIEVGRVEGYPGDDFFWFLIDKLIAKLPADLQQDPGT
jgi:hypothetical protein